MSQKIDKILVIDIEATCWEGSPPPQQENEIIEIGICVIDMTKKQPISKDSILVQPEKSTVSDFCTNLTTLTQTQVDQGVSFANACKMLRDQYNSTQHIWASYGAYDKNQFTKQCENRQIKYPFNPRHINVKTLFALVHTLPQEVGMASALDLINLPLEGTHHRGMDDAWNIAQILCRLLWQNIY